VKAIWESCSKICAAEEGKTLVTAVKYPLSAEDTPTNGSENASIRKGIAARKSPTIEAAANLLAAKSKTPPDMPKQRLYKMLFFMAEAAPFPFPRAVSSATSRVAARPEPEQAKVTAKRYTAIISEKSPIPEEPRFLVSHALYATPTIPRESDVAVKIPAFTAKFRSFDKTAASLPEFICGGK
jgi:hypothetical protein